MKEFNTVFIEQSNIVDCTQMGDQSLQEILKLNGKYLDQWQPVEKTKEKIIAVIGRGMSAEREVSLMSSNGIVKALINLGYQVVFIDMGADIASVLSVIKPDIAFNALHGTYGEDGCLPGLLNILRIPYTGPGVLASSLALNKKKSAEIFQANGIKIAKAKIIRKEDNIKGDPIPRPYVIKPLSQGSSIGIEVIYAEDDFDFSEYEFNYGNEIIVEQYIKGSEIQVAVLNGQALGTLELKLLKGKRFYDYETKYTEGFAEHILPARLSPSSNAKALQIAEKSCEAFECNSGIIRVELIYNASEDDFYMLELNTHPGMTPLSICPEIAANKGINYDNLVSMMVQKARFE